MALINPSPHTARSCSPNTKRLNESNRIVGTGPNVVMALFNNLLDYMKNRRVRLLDMFGMLSNEKRVITIASLQKSLPVIGINSTVSTVTEIFQNSLFAAFFCFLRPCLALASGL